mgnify:CR=1 FL=1
MYRIHSFFLASPVTPQFGPFTVEAVNFAGLTYTGGEVDVQLTYSVPEPSTVLLKLAGLIGWWGRKPPRTC